MSNLSELLPAGAGAKSAEFVASGTLSNGVAVGLKSDGEIEVIAETNNVETLGSAASSGSGNKQYVVACFDPSQNRFLIAYSDYGSNNYGKLVTASVSGSTLTFGTEYVYYSGAINSWVGLAYVPPSQKSVLAYKNVNEKGRAGLVSISSSGNPTLNGSYQFANYVYAVRYDVCYDASSGNVFFAYTDGSADLAGVVGSISGNTITYGSEVVKANSRTTAYARCAATTGGQVVTIYDRSGTTYTTLGNISGTAFTWATSDVSTTAVDTDSWDFCYDTTANKVVYFAADAGNSYYPSYRVGTISGTGTGASVSWSTATVVESGSRFYERIGYIPASNTYAVWYRTASNTYQVLGATLSGTTLTFPLAAKVMANFPTNTWHVAIAANTTQSSANAAAFAIDLSGAGNSVRRMYGASFTPGYTSTNVSSFIGITDQAIANTSTGAVIVQGGVSDKVSGLTTGSDYYVQANGTLSTSTSSVPAGRALSATSILLEG